MTAGTKSDPRKQTLNRSLEQGHPSLSGKEDLSLVAGGTQSSWQKVAE